ncbi:hypothetical protein RRG08_024236 [Elysia crispata]|uniref:Uncharacterized protein n=1 Tax=Elysia crispata TaxID=231223 RepID=A0AAE0YQ27_9GAST|nr:hypothetical protein RRG08_024236 [Elysia crispata]
MATFPGVHQLSSGGQRSSFIFIDQVLISGVLWAGEGWADFPGLATVEDAAPSLPALLELLSPVRGWTVRHVLEVEMLLSCPVRALASATCVYVTLDPSPADQSYRMVETFSLVPGLHRNHKNFGGLW